MPKNLKPVNIDELPEEIIELLQRIKRLGIEKYGQDLEKIESEAGEKEKSKSDSGVRGLHEAILDVVKFINKNNL